jgi:GH25 family lysozyme M1 (1,4-beta-N-acetylmuramidase)
MSCIFIVYAAEGVVSSMTNEDFGDYMKYTKNIKNKRYGLRLYCLILSFLLALMIPGMAVKADDNDILPDEVPAVSDDGEPAQEDVPAGEGNTLDDVKIPATRIITKRSRQTLKIGETYQYDYTLRPKNSDDYVIYKSANKNIATVSQSGLVTAISPGKVYVTITSGSGQRERLVVTVKDPNSDSNVKPDGVVLDDSFAKLRIGKTVQIYARMHPIGLKGSFTYKSTDKNVASVDSNGLVTGISRGETTITVTSGKFSASFHVSVYSGRYKGIDVSRWQGDIDWSKVNDDGIDFAMIRASYGTANVDTKLAANVAGCEKNGITYGFYHYTYAETPGEARIEARYFCELISSYNPEFPIVLDIEEKFYQKMSRKQVTDIIDAFASVVESYGHKLTIYSYANFLTNYTNLSYIQDHYTVWVASWGTEEKLNAWYDGDFIMWQYSSTGKVSGINGDVDLNYYYR